MSQEKEYEFNGFLYKDPDNENHHPVIEHHKEKPKYLFKFFGLSDYNVDALLNNYFFASHPFQLNDVLDSNPLLLHTKTPLPYESYEDLWGKIIPEEELKDYYEKESSQDHLCFGYISDVFEKVLSNRFGLVSTSEEEFSPLMWPHYTQEEGFQIKFNVEKMEKSLKEHLKNDDEKCLGLFPVNYTERLLPLDISKFTGFHIPFHYATNIKLNYWGYENEWRFILSRSNMGIPFSTASLYPIKDYETGGQNRYFYYDENLIEEICLGQNFFTNKKFEINWIDDTEFEIKAKTDSDGWGNKPENVLIDFISRKLKDGLYYSGAQFVEGSDGNPHLVRTKERMEITKKNENIYLLKRTGEVKNSRS